MIETGKLIGVFDLGKIGLKLGFLGDSRLFAATCLNCLVAARCSVYVFFGFLEARRGKRYLLIAAGFYREYFTATRNF